MALFTGVCTNAYAFPLFLGYAWKINLQEMLLYFQQNWKEEYIWMCALSEGLHEQQSELPLIHLLLEVEFE